MKGGRGGRHKASKGRRLPAWLLLLRRQRAQEHAWRLTSKPCRRPRFIMSLQRFGTRHINSIAFCGKEQEQLRSGNITRAGSSGQFHTGRQGPLGSSLILERTLVPAALSQRTVGLSVPGRGVLLISAGAPWETVTTCRRNVTQHIL